MSLTLVGRGNFVLSCASINVMASRKLLISLFEVDPRAKWVISFTVLVYSLFSDRSMLAYNTAYAHVFVERNW